MAKEITVRNLRKFEEWLISRERSSGTVESYLRTVRAFHIWLDGSQVREDSAAQWKGSLLRQGYHPRTVNVKLAAVRAFFQCMGWAGMGTKSLKIQRCLFREDRRELTREEYQRLIAAAEGAGKERLALVMEAICATGIRVSEVRYLTVEAARQGRAEVSLKGKIRTILLPGKQCRKLLKYAKKRKIASGEIFLTRGGKSLNRKRVWAEMKAVCKEAGIESSKVFPHNLRHLFARCFYRATRDVAKLADVLGHSSMETTRIYLITTGVEHVRILDRLRLIQ